MCSHTFSASGYPNILNYSKILNVHGLLQHNKTVYVSDISEYSLTRFFLSLKIIGILYFLFSMFKNHFPKLFFLQCYSNSTLLIVVFLLTPMYCFVELILLILFSNFVNIHFVLQYVGNTSQSKVHCKPSGVSLNNCCSRSVIYFFHRTIDTCTLSYRI